MDATTVAIDLAKGVLELAIADAHGHVVERKRLPRNAFSRCLANKLVGDRGRWPAMANRPMVIT